MVLQTLKNWRFFTECRFIPRTPFLRVGLPFCREYNQHILSLINRARFNWNQWFMHDLILKRTKLNVTWGWFFPGHKLSPLVYNMKLVSDWMEHRTQDRWKMSHGLHCKKNIRKVSKKPLETVSHQCIHAKHDKNV